MTPKPPNLPDVIAGLAAAYPRMAIGEATLSVYVRALRDLPLDEVMAAAQRIVRTSPYFPTIAELRTAVAEFRLKLPPPMEAWALVSQAATRGTLRTLPEPVRTAAEVVGGSWAIRTTENEIALRAQFVKAYAETRGAAVMQIVAQLPAPETRAITSG